MRRTVLGITRVWLFVPTVLISIRQHASRGQAASWRLVAIDPPTRTPTAMGSGIDVSGEVTLNTHAEADFGVPPTAKQVVVLRPARKPTCCLQ